VTSPAPAMRANNVGDHSRSSWRLSGNSNVT
jgi:hypothetical protein